MRRTDFVNHRSPVAAITHAGANVGQRDNRQDTSASKHHQTSLVAGL
jgi:hypothetical protein